VKLVIWTPIDVRIESDNSVVTLHEVVYRFKSGERIVVPPGFPCDLASVPWLFRSLMPSKLASAPFALLHDYLYAHAERVEQQLRGGGFPAYSMPRWQADELAERVAEDDADTDRWSEIYWLGVRLGGQRAWNRHRAARAAEAAALRAG
jgi:hypothetical protein